VSKTLVISACGYVDDRGFGRVPQPPSRLPQPLTDTSWSAISDVPFDRFGRLDSLCKHVVAAVEMLALPTLPEDQSRSSMAISLGTQFGSLGVDLAFHRSMDQAGGASPLLFSYTLPSTPIAEIAIRHRITGPNACYVAGAASGLLALWEGIRLIEDGEAESCVCIACDATLPDGPAIDSEHAYAFLVETEAIARSHAREPVADIGIEATTRDSYDSRAQEHSHAFLRRLVSLLAQDEPDTLSLPAPLALGESKAIVCRHLGRIHGRTG